ncbi:MAG TPA: hypothetical protein PKA64_00115 [Myxococcota bacterium]|nr:hypothetical protein [Myxococcota bacterium]
MTTALALRVPALEWCHRAGSGELGDLEWVDVRLDPELGAERQVRLADGVLRFRQRALMRDLPGVVSDEAVSAQHGGEVTAWEGLALLLARAEWLVKGRGHLWAPFSPAPRLLATLVETFGVEAPIHRYQPERLARLAALLPTWHPHRGTLARAREVLSTADESASLANAASVDELGGAEASRDLPRLRDEVLVCHSLGFWTHRAEPGAEPVYQISGGLVRFQPRSGPHFALRREDLLFAWSSGSALPHHAVRLLPAWTVIRLSVATP